MRDLTLSTPKDLAQWLRLYRLYLSAFPREERKPFSVIRNMYRNKKTDIWFVSEQGTFLGFATTINGSLILLDYLAVAPKFRGQGIGTQILLTLKKTYSGKGLFAEIESAYECHPDQEERLRRKQFYLNCGMEQLNVMASVFGVKMELLGWNCHLTFADYQAFYRDHYSPWAAQHIKQEHHPMEKGR
jgi:GNAT superfamily N-acetyltransferase